MRRRELILGAGLAWSIPAIPAIAAAQSTVELWTFIDPAADSVRSRALKTIIDTFEEQNPGVHIHTSIIAWNELGPAILRAARAGKTPDVALLGSLYLPQQIAAKAVDPLDPYLAKMDPRDRQDLVILPECIRDGKTFGIPYELRAWGIVYRTDLLKKLNLDVPDSLDALIDGTRKIEADQGADFAALGIGFNPSTDRAIKMFAPAALNLGAKLLNPDGSAAFNSPEMLKVMGFLYDAVNKYKVLPLDVALMTSDQVVTLTEMGRVGFEFEGTHWLNEIRAHGVPGTEFSWMPMPSFTKGTWQRASVEAWTLTIPTHAKNPGDAWKFISHWISPEMQLMQVKTAGYLPMRASLANDPSFNTPEMGHIKRAVEYAKANPLVFNWPDTAPAIQDTLASAITAVLSNKMSPEDALKDAEKNYNRVIGK
jgi:multiple sugar transport system substrate-binding protein